MDYYSYLVLLKDKPGDSITIRISVNSRVKNYLFNQIDELPEKRISQYGGESIELNAGSFRISRKILKSVNNWYLCFPNFKNKQGSLLIIGPSIARLFTDYSYDDLKKNYDITVKYIEHQRT